MNKAPGFTVEELFSRIVPFPQAGANSMHSEVLVTAFARDVVTWDRQEPCIIKGDILAHEEMRDIIKSNPHWRRVVAFRMPGEPA